MKRTTSPVACTLGEAGLAVQAERWSRLRRVAETGRVEREDGLELAFRDEPGVAAELQALVAVENECCSWARWELLRHAGGLTMRAGSTGAGVAALHSMFTTAAPPARSTDCCP